MISNSIRYPVDIADWRSTPHSSFTRRYACRGKTRTIGIGWAGTTDFFAPRRNRFLIASELFLVNSSPPNAPNGAKCARILFLPGFPFTTCLSCACYLRLSTARHSCLINKLQLIARAAVERIIRQSSASQLGYVCLVLISATLYINQ